MCERGEPNINLLVADHMVLEYSVYMNPRSLAPKLRPIVIIPPREDLWGPMVPYKPHRPSLASYCPRTLHFQPRQLWVGIGVR